jgi:branched-chain amino acid transport system permease protein
VLLEIFAQLLLNGLIAGGTYALAAVGYSMVYGALKFINFAHGSVAMVGLTSLLSCSPWRTFRWCPPS